MNIKWPLQVVGRDICDAEGTRLFKAQGESVSHPFAEEIVKLANQAYIPPNIVRRRPS